MKTLITGGAGFIGSHLVQKLLDRGDSVVVLDDFSMGKHENLPKHKNLVVFGGSILEDSVKFLFDEVDTVFHLAALTRPRESYDDPIKYNKVNVEGTLKTLLNAMEHDVKNFVFTSSASAYGYQKYFPFDEKYPLNPVSPYATTKQIGEDYCKLFTNMSKMKINSIRPFNVYGPRQDPNSPYGAAVPKFIQTLKDGGIPFITGNGEQFRDFVYVEDVADLMIKIADSDYNGEVFNCGSGVHTTLNGLYEIVCKLMDKDQRPNYVPAVADPNTLAGIDKANKFLEWTPKYSLIEGLTKMI